MSETRTKRSLRDLCGLRGRVNPHMARPEPRPPKERWRFQFRLRHLFVLITLLAVVCWWWTRPDLLRMQGQWKDLSGTTWDITIEGDLVYSVIPTSDGNGTIRTSTLTLNEKEGFFDLEWKGEDGNTLKQQGLYKLDDDSLIVTMSLNLASRPTTLDPIPIGSVAGLSGGASTQYVLQRVRKGNNAVAAWIKARSDAESTALMMQKWEELSYPP